MNRDQRVSERLGGWLLICGCLLVTTVDGRAADRLSTDVVRQAMRRAASYYRNQVARHGGYVYFYSPDLQQRWGEGAATVDQVWVQPPGTPTVGLAYLDAWNATDDPWYLDAARDAALALAYGQLKSGGWTNCIDFDPRGQRVAQYRNGQGRGKNNSSLDDGQTQSALLLVMRVDEELRFKDPVIHEAARVGLDALLNAQYPNGGFPQVWTAPVPDLPVVKARFPDYDWRTEGRIKNYWDMYTLNDNVAGHVARTLVEARRIYGDRRAARALRGLGDFLLLAQLPDPQPGWAQQYNAAMQPIWARKFEPPAVSGWESQDAIATLLLIAEQTGDARYLEPIPRALDYLRRSRLPDGRMARYYELQTNRPLYMERSQGTYVLTHDDSRIPDHYGWKMPARIETLAMQYERVRDGGPTASALDREVLASRVRRVIAALDDSGRWISVFAGEPLPGDQTFREGDRYISSAVFSENLSLLSQYLTAIAGNSDR